MMKKIVKKSFFILMSLFITHQAIAATHVNIIYMYPPGTKHYIGEQGTQIISFTSSSGHFASWALKDLNAYLNLGGQGHGQGTQLPSGAIDNGNSVDLVHFDDGSAGQITFLNNGHLCDISFQNGGNSNAHWTSSSSQCSNEQFGIDLLDVNENTLTAIITQKYSS